jgi:hypothetical protein
LYLGLIVLVLLILFWIRKYRRRGHMRVHGVTSPIIRPRPSQDPIVPRLSLSESRRQSNDIGGPSWLEDLGACRQPDQANVRNDQVGKIFFFLEL